jgi:hypothetical protein
MPQCSEELCGWIPSPETIKFNDLFWGYVWWCEDTYCDCSKARITLRRKNEYGFYNSHSLWNGKFYTDGEGHKHTSTELNRMAAHLRKHHNEFFHKIEWPWNLGEQ